NNRITLHFTPAGCLRNGGVPWLAVQDRRRRGRSVHAGNAVFCADRAALRACGGNDHRRRPRFAGGADVRDGGAGAEQDLDMAGGSRCACRGGGSPGLLRSIGPELVSAASDNDPTNVGTAAAVGAQAGYQLCWVAVLVAPLLGVVLAIAAQVGAVARDDLQS